MGKTMATTECRSVTSAIKELITIQKKTKNYYNRKHNEKLENTDRDGSNHVCTCTTLNTTNNLYSTV